MDLERWIYRNVGVFLILVLCCGNVAVNAQAPAPNNTEPANITPSETETSEKLQPSAHSTNATTTSTTTTTTTSTTTTSPTTPSHSATHSTTTSNTSIHTTKESSNTTTHNGTANTNSSTTSAKPTHSPSNETGENTTEASTAEITSTTETSPAAPTAFSTPTVVSSATAVESTSEALNTHAVDNSKIIIGVVVGVGGAVLIAVIVIVIVLWLRKRKNTNKSPGPGFGPSHVMTILPYLPDRPVAVADFLDYVAHHQANISAYKAEFESLPPGNKVGKSTSTANEQANKNLNRYINILPYNDSLVPLSTVDSKGYINASFVDGFRQEKPAYIASQAPLAESLGDFWQMVWEHDCGRIVMVTNLFERGQPKCNKYWPNVNDAANYGPMRVEAIAERTYGDYILRTFKISKQPSTAKDKPRAARRSKSEEQEELRETRLVYQFHFTTWPDQGVPNTCTALLKLYRHSIKDDLPDCRPGPVVIHCSAGVGRTGTLIALDLCLAQAKDKNTVDVPRSIDKMRRQRMYMVQTVEQYIFIHHVLLEALTLDKVEIPCATFITKYQQLIEPTMPDGQSRIQREFKVLEVLKPQFNSSMFSAAQQYRNKNRLSSLLPADSFIPYIPNEDETHTYINAVYVFGCPRRAVDDDDEEEEGCQYGFIATQSPTSNTIEDFWAMIKETGSSTIVMLNDLEGIERYWPEDGRTVTFGAYSVTNMGEIASEDIRMTDLQIAVTKKTKAKNDSPVITDESEYANASNINESEYANFERQTAQYATETFNIRHFRLLSWPDSLPKEATLISLYGEVVRCQERNPNRPVVVHCLYGAERCGVFCGVMSVLDTIKMECEVDVFNAVKRIRRTRPEFIPDLAQYKFLYDVAMEQIKTVDKVDYANGRFGTLLLGSNS